MYSGSLFQFDLVLVLRLLQLTFDIVLVLVSMNVNSVLDFRLECFSVLIEDEYTI